MKINLIFVISIIFLFGCKQDVKKTSTKLPPKTTFTKSLIDNLGSDVIVKTKSEFEFYCKNGSNSANDIDKLLKMIDVAIIRVKGILEIAELREGFYIIMIDSREDMERLINWNVKALASGRNDAAIFVYNSDIRPYFEHELFHLIAYNIWGEPAERVLDEGGAMYSDNQCLYYENPLSTINKHLYEDEKWFEIEELINNFNKMAGDNDLIAYLQAGFIFRHLYENYGKEKMKQLWRKGFTDFEQIYGFNINELTARIKEEMKEIKATEVDWDEIMEKGCG